jgi:cyclic pyranopterin phosphate synthase
LAVESLSIDFTFPDDHTLRIAATVQVEAKTGVEMEALTAVSVSALTVYDMCKSVDRGMSIGVQLQEKNGGRSGHWRRGS